MLMMLMTVLAAVYSRISELIDLYKFSLGAIAYCVVRMKTVLTDLGDDKAVQLAEEAKAKQERAQQMQYDWEKQKREDSTLGERARRLDDKIDKTISGMFRSAKGLAEMDVDNEASRLASELVDDLFPSGVFHITSKSFDDQYSTVNALLDRLKGEYAEHVDTLNLRAPVEKLGELNEEFGGELDPLGDEIEYDEVEAARADAEEAFHRLIARVMCEHSSDMETFNRIMQPVAEQAERARRHYKRRGTIPEIDEESGEPVEDTEQNNDSPDDLEGEGQNSGGSPRDETSDGESEGENGEN